MTCCIVLQLHAFHASAQFDIVYDQQGSFRNMIYDNVNRDMARHDKEMGYGTSKKPATVTKKTNPGNSLTFSASPSIRTEVIKKVAKDIAHGDMTKARTLENLLTKTEAVNNFNATLKKYTLTPGSLPDVLAGVVMVFWQVINNKMPGSPVNGIIIYRNELAASMRSNKKVLEWNDMKRQRVCESMALYANMAQGATQTAMTPAALQHIRETASNITGIDVAKYDFTDAGLRKK